MTTVETPEDASPTTMTPPSGQVVAHGGGIDRDRHAPPGHGVGAHCDLDRLPRALGWELPDRPQPVEPVGAEHVRRHHGDGDGAHHRVAQHRPVGRVAPRLPGLRDGARPDRRHVRVLRTRRERRRPAGQGLRLGRGARLRHLAGRPHRLRAGVHHRLRRRPFLHRHLGRLPRLAGCHLPHGRQAGADARAARLDVPAARWRSQGFTRRVAELVAGDPGVRGASS